MWQQCRIWSLSHGDHPNCQVLGAADHCGPGMGCVASDRVGSWLSFFGEFMVPLFGFVFKLVWSFGPDSLAFFGFLFGVFSNQSIKEAKKPKKHHRLWIVEMMPWTCTQTISEECTFSWGDLPEFNGIQLGLSKAFNFPLSWWDLPEKNIN